MKGRLRKEVLFLKERNVILLNVLNENNSKLKRT